MNRKDIEDFLDNIKSYNPALRKESQWIPTRDAFRQLCQLALKGLDAQEYVHRQSGSFDGQACAAAMRAYFSTDSGRTSIEVQPVSNPYLRNRIEAAFIAGWDAAAQRCELQP
jgi:hypothetical protein